jgi:anti-sigma regulatory factor (Ser/Thr protein kinase)
MVKSKTSFQLKNSLSELEALEEKLNRFSKQLGLTNRCFCEINLVLEELFSNIISYGYTDDAEHWIRFTLSHDDGTITMQIEDDGIAFNPLGKEEPDLECALEQRKIGGLGIHLMKKMMDDIIHQRCGDKNILTLKKHISCR